MPETSTRYKTPPLGGDKEKPPVATKRNSRIVPLRLGIAVLLILLGVTMTAGVMLGPVAVEASTVWKIALSHVPVVGAGLDHDWTTAQEHIVWDIRVPRVLLGALVGASLAVVGVVIQALVRNSLADPYILGVSSGASAGAVLVILFGAFQLFGQYALSGAAFLGALATAVSVFVLSQVGGRITTTRLLLSGIAISMMMTAITNFIVMSAPREEGIRNALFWMMGSLAGAKWSFLAIPAVIVLALTAVLMLHDRALNALLTGEDTAQAVGVNVQSFRKFLLVATALLTGTIVAVSGSIGFVGLMIPHIVRLAVGSDHRVVLPYSLLTGAIFLIWADVFARLVLAPEEMPIGIITSLVGAPFFIWLLRRSKHTV